MSTDQKIDEILNLVNSERELNSGRFRETKDLMKSEKELNNKRFNETMDLMKSEKELNSKRFNETMDLMKSERAINNIHFNQVSSGLIELNKKVDTLGVELKKEINQVYTSLSDDIRVFADDLDIVKKRLLKVERKIA